VGSLGLIPKRVQVQSEKMGVAVPKNISMILPYLRIIFPQRFSALSESDFMHAFGYHLSFTHLLFFSE
jgi:hypothetical protein